MGFPVQRFLVLPQWRVRDLSEEDREYAELFVADELFAAHPDVECLTAGWLDADGVQAVVAMGELPPCPRCDDTGGRLPDVGTGFTGVVCGCPAGQELLYGRMAALFGRPLD